MKIILLKCKEVEKGAPDFGPLQDLVDILNGKLRALNNTTSLQMDNNLNTGAADRDQARKDVAAYGPAVLAGEMQGGGSRYENKYRKYKSKYIALKRR